MRSFLILFLALSLSALYGQTDDFAEKMEEITGLDRDNFLIQGFSLTDRSPFLPERFKDMADIPVDIPLRKGVSALSPSTLITLLSKAGLQEDFRVLIVGEEGSYCATALSRAGMEVFLIDPNGRTSSAYSLKKELNNLNSWISMAPFDFILCLNPREEVPNQLLRQLSGRGILVTPLAADDLTQCWFSAESRGEDFILKMMGTASAFPRY